MRTFKSIKRVEIDGIQSLIGTNDDFNFEVLATADNLSDLLRKSVEMQANNEFSWQKRRFNVVLNLTLINKEVIRVVVEIECYYHDKYNEGQFISAALNKLPFYKEYCTTYELVNINDF